MIILFFVLYVPPLLPIFQNGKAVNCFRILLVSSNKMKKSSGEDNEEKYDVYVDVIVNTRL